MPFKYREFERKLTKLGYRIVRQKSSHVIFSDGKNTFPVPNHGSKGMRYLLNHWLDIGEKIRKSNTNHYNLKKTIFKIKR
jgi:predicted RNA binding protein YcfA (HicA-like mRNA interferase family)